MAADRSGLHIPLFDSDETAVDRLHAFLADGRFARAGAVVTDLDGTAVHEHEGRVQVAPSVLMGLSAVHGAGREVVINSLRFPLSVIRVFGADWVAAAGGSVPLVSMKGSQIGRLVARPGGEVEFEELDAAVLDAAEIDEILHGIDGVLDAGDGAELIVFHYPRDWRQGELIWTHRADRVAHLAAKYTSASRVVSGTRADLRERLLAEPLCMIFLLIERPGDARMAYQHTSQSSFHTHGSIDKRHGTEAIARHLGVELGASIGAGDAPPDTFLQATGFSVIVGNPTLDYRGTADTVRVPDAAAFGRLLGAVGRAIRR